MHIESDHPFVYKIKELFIQCHKNKTDKTYTYILIQVVVLFNIKHEFELRVFE